MGKKHTHGIAPLVAVAITLVAAVSVSASFASVLVAQEGTPAVTPAEPVKESDTENQQRQIRDQNNWIKNMQRELQDIKKQAKTADTSTADGLLAKFSACIQARQAEVGTQNFWNNIQDCNSMTRDIEDQFNDNLRPQRDCADRQRNISDRKRERKNLDSQIKDIQRMNKTADVSALTAVIAKIDALLAKADQIATGACNRDTADTLNDIQTEFNTLFQDFYNASNEIRELASCPQTQRNISDRKKERKNLDSQIKDIQRMNKAADVSALTAVITQIDALFTKANQVSTGVCNREVVDTLNDIQNELNTLFQDFYNSSNDVRQQADQGRQSEDNKRDYEKDKKPRCEKDKARELKNFVKEATKSGDADSAAAVTNIYNQMCVDALGAMKTALDAGNTDAYNEARSTYDDLDRTFWETLNENRQGVQEKAQKAQIVKDVTRDLKQKAKDLKRMKSALSRVTTSYNKVAAKYLSREERKQAAAELKAYIVKASELVDSISAGLTAADKAVKEGDFDTLDEYWSNQQDLDDMRQEFDDLQRATQMIPEVVKQLSNVEKQLKGAGRERQRLPEELQDQFDEFVSTIKGSVDNAWSVLISDPEAAMEELQSMQQANQDWEETKNAWYEDNQGDNGETDTIKVPLPF
ncbi:hypothetical protein HZA42_01515 [Candidatus Peregrinibacteria bacterium]|nr:hypothetical protein [Candidatus Peregrinibacteria bacterium]